MTIIEPGKSESHFEESPDEESLQDARKELDAAADATWPRQFIYACKFSDIPKNGNRGKVIFCENDEVTIFNISGKLYAISNICPHQDSPLLSEGHVEKEALTVACPLHGWTYRLDNGKSVAGDRAVKTYEVRILQNEVWIEEPPLREIFPVTFE